MASYTMQLREYVEQATQYEEGLSMKDRIEKGRKKLFDFDYPIFDEKYRNVFETHFIRNFYMREIGFETEGLFKFKLETWLMINMPYFNKLFESELIKFDPLQNSEMNVTHNKTNDKQQNDQRDTNQNVSSDSKSDSSTDSESKVNTTQNQTSDGEMIDDNFDRQLESNNPDSRLNITAKDGEGVIEYAHSIKENNENNKKTASNQSEGSSQTDATDDVKNRSTSESKTDAKQNDVLVSDINEIEDFIQHRVGKIGVQSYSKMIMEFRSSFIRVENQIFKEMNELFMLVY